jgi:hypothetical protein
MVDGQTMVDHGFQKPIYETCGPGSSPPIGIFIFYFFIYFVRLRLRIMPVSKFWRKSCPLFFYRIFIQKIAIIKKVLNISPKFLHWDDSEAQPDKIH